MEGKHQLLDLLQRKRGQQHGKELGLRRNLLKKPYYSPEFDLVKFNLSTVICTGITTSAENVVPGVDEPIEDDDIG